MLLSQCDCADTQFSSFAIEYLRENETFRKTVFACSYGAQVEYIRKEKKWSKISWHCPFDNGLFFKDYFS